MSSLNQICILVTLQRCTYMKFLLTKVFSPDQISWNWMTQQMSSNCKCISITMLNKGRTSSLILTICKCSSFSNMIYFLEIKLSSNNKYNFVSSIFLSKTNPQRVSWVLYGFYTYSAIQNQCSKSFYDFLTL